jgi:outer membrane protein OmpA-like peptidoglycan-associated protein
MTKERLDKLISEIKSGGFTVKRITVVGHADRANHTGQGDYNIFLAQDRATNVKNYLVAQGVPTDLIKTYAKGDSEQVEACQGKFTSRAELEECLLPNRRVEVVVEGMK